MSWTLWLVVGLGLLVCGLAFFWAIRSGAIWQGIYAALKRAAKAIFIAMLPGILKIFKPASTEELARRKAIRDRGGEDAPSGRPFGRQKGE
jgi:hypothetical protein